MFLQEGFGGMKNVVLVVCDGLSYDMTIDKINHKTPMKFLNGLREKAVSCERAYSQAPYTEGGVMGLLYGRNPLDNGAYLCGMQEWEGSLFKAFHENGYALFSSYFGSFLPPEMMIEGQYVYDMNYFTPLFSRYIRGKLDYYRGVETLEVQDYSAISKLLKRHFESMLLYHSEKALANDRTGDCNPCIPETEERMVYIREWKEKVVLEYNVFLKDKHKYIDELFTNYEAHFLTTECDLSGLPMRKELVEHRRWVKKQYRALFKKIKQKNRAYFIRKHRFPMRAIVRYLRDDRKKAIEMVYRAYQDGFVFDKTKMISTDLQQLCTSAKGFVHSFIEWNEHRDDSEPPFFTYLHFDEFHRPLSFYTMDIADKELTKSELDEASKYVMGLERSYSGNIAFDLAARYLDDSIHMMYSYLAEKDLLKDTIFVVTADHGSSNFGGEVRYTVTNNFYDEQYHIPLVVVGANSEKKINSFVNIKDIPYMLLTECGIQIPKLFSGENFLTSDKKSTFVEYLGTGVPDMLRRPVLFLYRDEKVAYLLSAKLMDPKEEIKILYFYDLLRDPYQHRNIANEISLELRNECIDRYRPRYMELKENYTNWCSEE